MGMQDELKKIKAARKAAEAAGKAKAAAAAKPEAAPVKRWAAAAPTSAPAGGHDQHREAVAKAIHAATQGGLAHLSDVRKNLEHLGMDRKGVDALLEHGEKKGWLSLKTANYHSKIDKTDAIVRHNPLINDTRHLIYAGSHDEIPRDEQGRFAPK